MKLRRVLSALLLVAVVTTSTLVVPASAAGKVSIEEIDYDMEDRELSVDFWGHVSWKKGAKVIVKTAGGKKVKSYVIKKDSDDVEVHVKLKLGKKYKVIVKGVRKGYSGKFGKVVRTFRAYDD